MKRHDWLGGRGEAPVLTFEAEKAVARLQAVIAIPARNEARRLPSCLKALGDQQGLLPGSFGVVFFINNTIDESEAVIAAIAKTLPCPLRVVVRDNPDATAGWARRSAMEVAADWLAESGADDGLLLTTDADSQVGPLWVRKNLDIIAEGADAVAGRIQLDPGEAEALPAALHARGRLESDYETLLTEIGARLDPEPANPWPCHWTASGASIAVRLRAYHRVGGMPALAVGEDAAFIKALRAQDARVRHAPEIVVTTSGRLVGRAPGGAADTMRLRCEQPDSPCDGRLEALPRALWRVRERSRLRRLHGTGGLGGTRNLASRLEISHRTASNFATEPFGRAYQAIEAESPKFHFIPLRPSQLPGQIRLARIVVLALRFRDWLGREDNPGGNDPCAIAPGPVQNQPTSV